MFNYLKGLKNRLIGLHSIFKLNSPSIKISLNPYHSDIKNKRMNETKRIFSIIIISLSPPSSNIFA